MPERFIKYCVLSIFFIFFLFPNCNNEFLFNEYDPVYMSYEDLRSSFRLDAPRNLSRTGKIYLYGNILFINEYKTGIHILDYSNQASPQNLGFMNIPGNIDIEIKNNTLYADSYMDLLVIDISNLSNPALINRYNNYFPYPSLYPDTEESEIYYQEHDFIWFNPADEELGVVTGWQDTGNTVSDPYGYNGCGPVPLEDSDDTSGSGGSMARFTIVKQNYLYMIDNFDLHILDITNETSPVDHGFFYIGMGIETLYINADTLFIGSTTAVYLYDIWDPLNPVYLSNFVHSYGCDPVVADNNYAYSTLRANMTGCWNGDNELIVLDISILTDPVLVSSYQLSGPYGLALDYTTRLLYVCDGTGGIYIFNASTSPYLTLTGIISPVNSDSLHDIILNGSSAYVVGSSGVYLYDISNASTGVMPIISTYQIIP